jgi:hypothetical protein
MPVPASASTSAVKINCLILFTIFFPSIFSLAFHSQSHIATGAAGSHHGRAFSLLFVKGEKMLALYEKNP